MPTVCRGLRRRGLWRRAAAGVDGCRSAHARRPSRSFARGCCVGRAGVRDSGVDEPFVAGDAKKPGRRPACTAIPRSLVGHLDRNKDPLTVLDGVEAAAGICRGSALVLLRLDRAFAGGRGPVARAPALCERVHLLGRVPHERLGRLMRAADLFVHGSHREGCSTVLIESLATGLLPIVTDIRLRARCSGAAGILWRCGDARSLCDALRHAAAAAGEESRARSRSLRRARIEFRARPQFAAAYGDLVRSRLAW